MLTTRDHVLEFHKTYDCPVRLKPEIDVPEKALRVELIREELEDELIPFIKESDIVEIADALGDLEYVIEGAAITFGVYLGDIDTSMGSVSVDLLRDGFELLKWGVANNNAEQVQSSLRWMKVVVRSLAEYFEIPLDEVIAVIHESNMSKLGEDGKPIYRENDGKILKGPNFFTPTQKIKEILGVGDDVELSI